MDTKMNIVMERDMKMDTDMEMDMNIQWFG